MIRHYNWLIRIFFSEYNVSLGHTNSDAIDQDRVDELAWQIQAVKVNIHYLQTRSILTTEQRIEYATYIMKANSLRHELLTLLNGSTDISEYAQAALR